MKQLNPRDSDIINMIGNHSIQKKQIQLKEKSINIIKHPNMGQINILTKINNSEFSVWVFNLIPEYYHILQKR